MIKNVLITGATSGIGKSLAKLCAKKGYNLIITGRHKEKAESAHKEILNYSKDKSVKLFIADLSLLKETGKLAEFVKSNFTRLDVLVNNAALSLPKRETTREGIEKVFATNHLSYFYITELLLDLLKLSAPSRIINVSSEAHMDIDFTNIMSEMKYNQYKVYGKSKAANIMFTYLLSEKLKGTGVNANCLHPGVVRSRIYDNVPFPVRIFINMMKPFFISADKSAEYIFPLVHDDKFSSVTGKYFVKGRESESKEFTYIKERQERLWEICTKIIAERSKFK